MTQRPNWVDYVFVGTYGHVVAIDQENGETVWKVSLPRTGFSIASIIVENGQVLCGSGGRVFALEPETGEILWSNGMPGMGHGYVLLATAQSSGAAAAALVAESAARKSSAAGSGASTGTMT